MIEKLKRFIWQCKFEWHWIWASFYLSIAERFIKRSTFWFYFWYYKAEYKCDILDIMDATKYGEGA